MYFSFCCKFKKNALIYEDKMNVKDLNVKQNEKISKDFLLQEIKKQTQKIAKHTNRIQIKFEKSY